MKPLSDEEVPGWLRDGELDLWRYWVVENVRPNGNVPNALRSLAETRRALADREFYKGLCMTAGCPAVRVCVEGPRHTGKYVTTPAHLGRCIFSTMPRPGRPEVRG